MASRNAAGVRQVVTLLVIVLFVCRFDLSADESVLSTAKTDPESPTIETFLGRPILDPQLPRRELCAYVDARIPEPAQTETQEAWIKKSTEMRQRLFEKVVYCGMAKEWAQVETKAVWCGEIEGGPGYRIKKFRYEVVPGFWAPALLYEPSVLAEKMPVFVNVNGHHAGGKAMPYKQRRCIHQAKNGILSFNLEFINMGQLRDPGNGHNKLVQMDVCGTSGLAVFYLTMKRGLDIALAHEKADPTRVGVAGLSGGGWQTIWLAAMDTRITLANPVAGYCSIFGRTRHANNVGDAEQIPSDLCTVGDYTHLTQLLPPRPLLLTLNEKDDCCFRPDVLPRLEQAAKPIYQLFGCPERFAVHINRDPGTHNFDSDNRQALNRVVHEHFYSDAPCYDPSDIPAGESEIKTAEQLEVPMPEHNETLHSLAVGLARSLDRPTALPSEPTKAKNWQKNARQRLHEVVVAEEYSAILRVIESGSVGDVSVRIGTIRLDDVWTVPFVDFSKGNPNRAVVLICDSGFAEQAAAVKQLLGSGQRVCAVDLSGFGGAIGTARGVDWMLTSTVGSRLLGIQTAQLEAVARSFTCCSTACSVEVHACGPRTSIVALVAAGLEGSVFSRVTTEDAWGSLSQLVYKDWDGPQAPELFGFGLLSDFDVPDLAALVAPRPVVMMNPDSETRHRLETLKSWYRTLGVEFDPLQ